MISLVNTVWQQYWAGTKACPRCGVYRTCIEDHYNSLYLPCWVGVSAFSSLCSVVKFPLGTDLGSDSLPPILDLGSDSLPPILTLNIRGEMLN